jgi:hypothetical protein
MGIAPVERNAVRGKCRLPIADCRLPIEERGIWNSNWRLAIGYRLLITVLCLASLRGASVAATNSAADRATVMIIVGTPGEAGFGSNFVQQAELWQKACGQAGARALTLGLDSTDATNDYERFKQMLAAEPKDGIGPLWLVLIGHGTFDGKETRFNLRGPDVSATELSSWLQPFHRPMAVINTTASSSPFMAKLSGTNRVVVTATRSGSEQNYARFGQYFARAITDPQADLDKDGQISLLEAFLTASRQAGEFYKVEGRLLTEHALIDDNGDKLGTPADWFRGLRAVRKPRDGAALDGLLAQQFQLIPGEADRALSPEQRARRDALERAVLLHRERRAQMSEDEYYAELERLLVDLAQFYASNGAAKSGTK